MSEEYCIILNEKEQERFKLVFDNLHSSLKWFWQIIMVTTFAQTTRVFAEAVLTKLEKYFSTNEISQLFSISSLAHTLCYVSFTLIFSRIFLGDTRMLDIWYKEDIKTKGLQYVASKYSPYKVCIDAILLVSHSIIFIFMSISIVNPMQYSVVVTVFLIVNALWLWKNKWHYGAGAIDEYTKKHENYAVGIWAANNSIFGLVAILVLFILYANNGTNIWLYITILQFLFILNSIVDYVFTFSFYFPNLVRKK